MNVTQHGQHLTQLTRLKAVNAYLVREEDGLTLVDTMMGGSAKAILAAAQALGAPIRRIVLTHAHGDHVGSLDALAQALPGVEVAMSARDARFLTGDKTLDAGEPESKLRGGYVTTRTRPRTLLEPGDPIGSLEVVAAPGHTPGQIALVDTRDRTLIAGDAFSTLGGVATSAKVNWRFPLVTMATWDRPTALRTARALRGLEPSRLAIGHGPVVEAPGTAMERAIGKAA